MIRLVNTPPVFVKARHNPIISSFFRLGGKLTKNDNGEFSQKVFAVPQLSPQPNNRSGAVQVRLEPHKRSSAVFVAESVAELGKRPTKTSYYDIKVTQDLSLHAREAHFAESASKLSDPTYQLSAR